MDSRKNLFIISADVKQSALLAEALYDIEALEFGCAGDAIGCIAEKQPCCILAGGSENGGIQAIRQALAELSLNVPVIALCGCEDTAGAEEALKCGADDVICFPVSPAVVRRRVRGFIERYEAINAVKSGGDEERFRIVREAADCLMCEYNIRTGERYYSKNMNNHFAGVYNESTSLIDEWVKYGVIQQEDVVRYKRCREEMLGGAAMSNIAVELKTNYSGWQWYKLTFSLCSNESGEKDRLLLAMLNVEDDINQRLELHKKDVTIDLLTRTMNVGMKISDITPQRKLSYINSNLCDMFGCTIEEFEQLYGGDFSEAIFHADREEALQKSESSLRDGSEYCCEYRIKHKDGSLIWVQDTGKKFMDNDGAWHINSVLTDISPLKEAIETLQYKSEYDELTGINNKRAFFDNTRKMLEANLDKQYLLIKLDVERFKVINDLYGMCAGNELLQYIANVLTEHFAAIGTFGRLEADNFAVCTPLQGFDIDAFMSMIDGELGELPIDFKIVVCFGLYVIDDRDVPVEIMCDRAGLALRTVKGNFMKRYAYYTEDLRNGLIIEQEIVNDMNAAIAQRQFDVYLQPQFNHATGDMIGAEALVRWLHPTKGMISPGVFIPIFEKNGFIMRLDEYIWERVCEMLRDWIDRGIEPAPVSVNISRLDINNPSLCDTLIGLMQKYRLPVELLKLEITETAYVENSKHLANIVERLHRSGFMVILDDFGSGYSSLKTLKDIPIDELKLDLKFLSGDDPDSRGGNILTSMIRMARWLSLPVIAEGVETREQADFLKTIGCTIVQGYYYSMPLTASEYERLLKKHAAGAKQGADEELKVSIDMNEFWNPQAQMTLVFNSFVGAAGIFEYYDNKLEAVRVNDKYYQVVGRAREEYERKRFALLDYLIAEDGQKFTDMLNSAISSGSEVEAECRWRRDSGAYPVVWLRIRARLIARNGDRYLFYAAIENTTEKRLTEQKLEKIGLNLKAVLDTLPVAACVIEAGEELTALYMNDAYYTYFGYDKDNARPLPIPINEYVSREESDAIFEKAQQHSHFEASFSIKDAKGGYTKINAEFKLLLTNENGATTYLEVIKD